MTDQERADVRTAYRPLVEGVAGKPGTVSYAEWEAAVERVFPVSPALTASRASKSQGGRNE